jgi:hypothetical protein
VTGSGDGPPLRSITARRILAAFGAVLVLFGIALAVELVTLHKIAGAESDVARLDHAKHAGTTVVPAITHGDRDEVAKLGDDLEDVVERVVRTNARLNSDLEARSVAARERAETEVVIELAPHLATAKAAPA